MRHVGSTVVCLRKAVLTQTLGSDKMGYRIGNLIRCIDALPDVDALRTVVINRSVLNKSTMKWVYCQYATMRVWTTLNF